MTNVIRRELIDTDMPITDIMLIIKSLASCPIDFLFVSFIKAAITCSQMIMLCYGGLLLNSMEHSFPVK